MSDEEQEQRITDMDQPQRDDLLATLENMIQQAPEQVKPRKVRSLGSILASPRQSEANSRLIRVQSRPGSGKPPYPAGWRCLMLLTRI